jgi:hypothetical protein
MRRAAKFVMSVWPSGRRPRKRPSGIHVIERSGIGRARRKALRQRHCVAEAEGWTGRDLHGFESAKPRNVEPRPPVRRPADLVRRVDGWRSERIERRFCQARLCSVCEQDHTRSELIGRRVRIEPGDVTKSTTEKPMLSEILVGYSTLVTTLIASSPLLRRAS